MILGYANRDNEKLGKATLTFTTDHFQLKLFLAPAYILDLTPLARPSSQSMICESDLLHMSCRAPQLSLIIFVTLFLSVMVGECLWGLVLGSLQYDVKPVVQDLCGNCTEYYYSLHL